ncbi:AhpC/TSA family protein [Pedobacter sp. MC2016-14]|uniref:TlpA disulfide reductase family protein n=1 Tax=Pedobacter sp. MC2016-14 TaxID=2897327 RepID=UPI001E593CA6|nr:TlpA disulfide reductase family protein [Pedobacter sp. MC2016-14]MCD0488106.1 AhpC/TSA family protein [Pedobacter sp. MC2016-14]
MNKIIKLALAFTLMSNATYCIAQDFSLEGELKNFTGSSVTLNVNKQHAGRPEAISIPVKAGKFKYSGSRLRSPYMSSLMIEPQKQIQLVLYNEPIKILADVNDLTSAKISGGGQINQYNEYTQATKEIDEQIKAMLPNLRDIDRASAKGKLLMEQYYALSKQLEIKAASFIEKNPSSGLSPYLLWSQRLDPEKEIKLYSALDSNLLADNSYFKFISPSMVAQRNTWIGKALPKLSQADTSGKMVSLTDFNGKYLLIDFWASWCVPCRAANPGMVKLYNRFKDKNFTILGISLDKAADREKWIGAIKHDGLTWNHVSDLKYWDNEISRAFGLTSIPATVLVDPSGKIIARDLSEGQLEEVLEKKLN